MCGVVGYVAAGEGLLPDELKRRLKRALEAMSHRGPDGEGVYVSDDGRVGLGHRRLAVIDISDAASQPMTSADGRHVLVFNGEYFRYREERRRLSSYPFQTNSDTEVLLAEFNGARDPRDVLNRADAMFALALYDRHSSEVLLARDATGVKPLYYAVSEHGVWFASEPCGLFAAGAVTPKLDTLKFLVNAALRMECPVGGPWFPNVESVEPGTLVRLAVGNPRPKSERFWMPVAEQRDIEPEEVEAAFAESVRARMVADRPRAVLLSGGVDSTAIYLALSALGAGAPPYTATYQATHDELETDVRFARAVAESQGDKLRVTSVTCEELPELLRRSVGAVARPIVHGCELTMYASYRGIAQDGGVVVFSGHGSDEAWGYQDGRYFPPLSLSRDSNRNSANYMRNAYLRELHPGWFDHVARWYCPALEVDPNELEEVAGAMVATAYERLDSRETTKRFRYYLFCSFLVYVNEMVDALSMAWGLEDRPIFQSAAMVRLSFAVAEARKNHLGIGDVKPFLKQALARRVPPDVLGREKIGFQPPRARENAVAGLRVLADLGMPFGISPPAGELERFTLSEVLFAASTATWLKSFALA